MRRSTQWGWGPSVKNGEQTPLSSVGPLLLVPPIRQTPREAGGGRSWLTLSQQLSLWGHRVGGQGWRADLDGGGAEIKWKMNEEYLA